MGGVQVCQRRNKNGDNPSGTQVAAEEAELWSARDSIELCAEGEEHMFRSKARLLDVTEVSTVAAAVQSLNQGRLSLPEGFGVVHSATRGRYFLLWQKDRKGMAMERLGVDETHLEARAHQRGQLAQPPRRQPFSKSDALEFQITLDRTGGLPLGIDVQKAANERLIIECVGESGLVASWNASNLDHQVKSGDHVIEVNGKRGDTEAIVNECRQHQCLVMSILSHRVAEEETFNFRTPPSTERRDASCNTSPYDPNEEPSRAEVCLPIAVDAEPDNQAFSGSSSSSSGDKEQATARNQPAKVTKEYAIELDRTGGSKLGVDVAPAHEAEPKANLLIEGISEGLVKSWNDAHPDLRVEVGDSIVEVNGYRGDLRKMIDECKMDQLLRVTLQRDV